RDHHHWRMAKVVDAELGPAGDEDVGLEDGVLARDVVDGGYEDLVLLGHGVAESYEESPDDALVGDLRRRRHDEGAVDELVAVAVVGHGPQVVVGERHVPRQGMRHAPHGTGARRRQPSSSPERSSERTSSPSHWSQSTTRTPSSPNTFRALRSVSRSHSRSPSATRDSTADSRTTRSARSSLSTKQSAQPSAVSTEWSAPVKSVRSSTRPWRSRTAAP